MSSHYLILTFSACNGTLQYSLTTHTGYNQKSVKYIIESRTLGPVQRSTIKRKCSSHQLDGLTEVDPGRSHQPFLNVKENTIQDEEHATTLGMSLGIFKSLQLSSNGKENSVRQEFSPVIAEVAHLKRVTVPVALVFRVSGESDKQKHPGVVGRKVTEGNNMPASNTVAK